MAIDFIHTVFPAAAVAWERTPRVAVAKMVLTVSAGKELLAQVGAQGLGAWVWGSGVRITA
jgi:hypothetical protein